MSHKESADGTVIFIPLEETRLQLGDKIVYIRGEPHVERPKAA